MPAEAGLAAVPRAGLGSSVDVCLVGDLLVTLGTSFLPGVSPQTPPCSYRARGSSGASF